jgi:hypothetical protein
MANETATAADLCYSCVRCVSLLSRARFLRFWNFFLSPRARLHTLYEMAAWSCMERASGRRTTIRVFHYVEQPRQKTQRSPFAAESLLKAGRAPRAARRDPPHRRSDPNRCARRARGEPAEGATKASSARRITRSTFSSCHVSAQADDADGPDRDTNFGTVSTPALRGGRDEP